MPLTVELSNGAKRKLADIVQRDPKTGKLFIEDIEIVRKLKEVEVPKYTMVKTNKYVAKELDTYKYNVVEKDTVKWKVQYIMSRYNFELEKKLQNATAEIMLDFFNKKKKEEKEKDEAKKLEKEKTAKEKDKKPDSKK